MIKGGTMSQFEGILLSWTLKLNSSKYDLIINQFLIILNKKACKGTFIKVNIKKNDLLC